jgi:hypothetical protein
MRLHPNHKAWTKWNLLFARCKSTHCAVNLTNEIKRFGHKFKVLANIYVSGNRNPRDILEICSGNKSVFSFGAERRLDEGTKQTRFFFIEDLPLPTFCINAGDRNECIFDGKIGMLEQIRA